MTSLVRSGRWGRRLGMGVVAVGLTCFLAAGCGAAHKKAGSLTPGTTAGTIADLSGSTTSSTAVTGSKGGAGATTTTAAPKAGGGTASGASGAGGSTKTGGGAPQPAAPGTYTVNQSGGVTAGLYSSSEPAQGTLVVDPAQPDGTQMWHRYVDSKNPPATTDMQFRSNGPFILSATEASPQGNTTCTFNPPIAAPPWPPAAGDTFGSVGNCGSFTVTVHGKIAGTQSVTLADGETFTVWVIDSTLDISGQVTGSGTQVDWYSPAVRLPLHEQVDISGTYQGINFKLHSVSDLTSSHPS